jgi:Xaa-Pro dipeptidase
VLHDKERVDAIEDAMRAADLDVLVCVLPANVLLLSGYWPVVGASVALATRGRNLALVVPADERELAAGCRADEITTFESGSLGDLRRTEDALRCQLARVAPRLLAGRGRVGFEDGGFYEPASYSAAYRFGPGLRDFLSEILPAAELCPANVTLTQLRTIKTPTEVERIRTSCRLAGLAFQAGAGRLRPGMRENEAAAAFSASLAGAAGELADEERVSGFFYCMSGPNAALACRDYARSRGRRLGVAEPILVHCNSCTNGYWTDISRSFFLGKPGNRLEQAFEAVFAARAAALDTIRPGVSAAAVDRAARQVLEDRGFGPAFKHPTGHGVGFGAIDHAAPPQIHPCSTESLAPGVVFNVEPAVYLDGIGGVRQCDMVAVTATGFELLTDFQSEPAELIVAIHDAP